MPLVPAQRCVCGDARDDASYRAALGDQRADLLLTDPPYCLLTRRRRGGELRDPRRGKKIDREPVLRFETVRDYRAFTAEWLPQALKRLRAGAPVALWTNFLGKQPLRQVAADHGYPHLWGEFVWGKRTQERSGNEELLRVYEVALVFGAVPAAPESPHAPATPWSVVTGYDDEGEASRWGDHPHHKPFGALEPLLRTYSRPGDLVLDPFAGSGSIPAAAVRLGRRTACMEKTPEWAQRVVDRLSTTAGTPGY